MTDREYEYRPTRDFFEQDRKAATIRNICMRAIDASMMVLMSEGRDQPAVAALEAVDMELHGMEITAGMHAVLRDDPDYTVKLQEIISSPLMTAEWIAGQIRHSLMDTSGFMGSGSMSATTNHNEIEASEVYLVDHAVGPSTKKFMGNLALIGALGGFLDYEAGLSEIE